LRHEFSVSTCASSSSINSSAATAATYDKKIDKNG
jgi:hypothetical protein